MQCYPVFKSQIQEEVRGSIKFCVIFCVQCSLYSMMMPVLVWRSQKKIVQQLKLFLEEAGRCLVDRWPWYSSIDMSRRTYERSSVLRVALCQETIFVQRECRENGKKAVGVTASLPQQSFLLILPLIHSKYTTIQTWFASTESNFHLLVYLQHINWSITRWPSKKKRQIVVYLSCPLNYFSLYSQIHIKNKLAYQHTDQHVDEWKQSLKTSHDSTAFGFLSLWLHKNLVTDFLILPHNHLPWFSQEIYIYSSLKWWEIWQQNIVLTFAAVWTE